MGQKKNAYTNTINRTMYCIEEGIDRKAQSVEEEHNLNYLVVGGNPFRIQDIEVAIAEKYMLCEWIITTSSLCIRCII
jgi:hypothetical protein